MFCLKGKVGHQGTVKMLKFYKKVLSLIFLTIFLINGSSLGANPNSVKLLGISEGLSNNMATCVFRDNYGFMWIGTFNGLNRYDGVAVKIFEKDLKNPQSLINNHVTCLTGGAHNRIWIGTNKGLAIYDYNDGKIHPGTFTINGRQAKIFHKINTLTADPQGNVFVGTNKGLLVADKGMLSCVQIRNSVDLNIQALTVDKNGIVWLFIERMGLGVYDRKSKKIKIINAQLKTISTIAADPQNGNIWLGNENGIFEFDVASRELKNTFSKMLNNTSVMKIFPDRSAHLWIATDGGGLNLIDLQTKKVTFIGAQKDGFELSSTSVQDVFKDREDRLWIATLRGGVNIIDTKKQMQFNGVVKDPQNPNSLVSNFTRSFCEDRQGDLWIGTSGGGLSRYNPRTGTFKNFRHQEFVQGSLSSDFVFSIIQDKRENIWIATLKGGVNRYLPSSGTFKHYRCIDKRTSKLVPSIWRIYQDSKNNIWAAATRGGGIFKYNALNDSFELFDSSLVDITAIFEDRSGNLWMANASLIKIDPEKKKHLHFPIGSAIHSIVEDRRGGLWLGTEGDGLILFNPEAQHIRVYTKNDGLPDNTVLSILEDNSGSLWFSTFNGLGKFDFIKKKFRCFYVEDGLQNNQFNFNAALKMRNGEMIFGGLNGFDWFNPAEINLPVKNPLLYITDIRSNNISIQQDLTKNKIQNIIELKNIQVDYDKAAISVDYVALDYSYSKKIRYAYFLEGWDNGWIKVGKQRTAFYSHLDVGTYKLHIRSTNSQGAWSFNERLVTITVLPPWYRTWWAYSLWVAIFFIAVYISWSYSKSRLKLKREVENTRFIADRDRALNEKKISFFTDISHEFKTPLTLIINPIKDLLQSSSFSNNQELRMIYRNTKRLLGLVDQLLLFRKAEAELHELKFTEFNLVRMVEEVFQCFTLQAKSKGLSYAFYHSQDEITICADEEKMEIILFNLIANAINFTPREGHVNVELESDLDGEITLIISDTGSGIPKGLEEKLFEKYYRMPGKQSAPGFGIGLYLVKTFVNLHHGHITYENNPLGGTIFTLSINKGSAAPFGAQVSPQSVTTSNYRKEIYQQEPLLENDEEEDSFGQLDLLISDRQSLLIIDDDQDMRAYIAKIFKADYKVYEAAEGAAGIAYAKQYVPDIIISDINMEGMDGITLCKTVINDSLLGHIPVILITGDVDPVLEIQGLQIGAVDFISKPFEKDLLIAKVKNITRNKADLQKYFFNQVTLKNDNSTLSEADRDFLYKSILIIEQNLLTEEFNVQLLADEMGMSYSGLYKRIKMLTNGSVNNLIRFVRIRKSAELMINTSCNINEAALNVGFNDIKYFREHFMKIFKMTPSKFIKKHRASFRRKYLKNLSP